MLPIRSSRHAHIEATELLDVKAHELVFDGRRVALTQLEFEAMNCQSDPTGKVATRRHDASS